MQCLCRCYIFTGQNNRTVCFEFFDGFSVQDIFSCRAVSDIVFSTIIIRLFDKIQASRFTHLFQNGGCIGCTRDFNGDTVVALQIYLCLFAVLLRTLFQLVAGI